jgi:hypothetical protein
MAWAIVTVSAIRMEVFLNMVVVLNPRNIKNAANGWARRRKSEHFAVDVSVRCLRLCDQKRVRTPVVSSS